MSKYSAALTHMRALSLGLILISASCSESSSEFSPQGEEGDTGVLLAKELDAALSGADVPQSSLDTGVEAGELEDTPILRADTSQDVSSESTQDNDGALSSEYKDEQDVDVSSDDGGLDNEGLLSSDVQEGSTSYPLDELLRLNHLQVKGTHNSYHQEPDFVFHPSHAYTHPPLDEQLGEHGVRAFELDVHLEGDEVSVYHILFIDEKSSCDTFAECLSVMKGWSDANPGHLPIMVWIEAKQETGGQNFEDLGVLDEVIESIFPPERLLTPDDVKAGYGSLREALEKEGWPRLSQVRNRAMFMVLNGGSGTDAYTHGGQHLEGRAMFMGASASEFGAPWAAVAKINDPGSVHVSEAHAHNILVASNGCSAESAEDACFDRLETALSSGVQMYKDDFVFPIEGMTYWLDFPDGQPARCNAVTAPPECTAEALESL